MADLLNCLALVESLVRMQEQGPEHAKTFTLEVRVGKEYCGQADARTKKIAAQRAARAVYERLLAEVPVLVVDEDKLAADERR